MMSNCPFVLSVGATSLVADPNNTGGTGSGTDIASPTTGPPTTQTAGNGTAKDGKAKSKGKHTPPPSSKKPNDRESVVPRREFLERAPTSFSSGGGFSNVFSTPWYQLPHVSSYIWKANLSQVGYNGGVAMSPAWYFNISTAATWWTENVEPGGKLFNKLGRGYPDVAALGDYFRVINSGYVRRMGGTSVAVPIWASIITLVNEERLAKGKRPVGFVHQVLVSLLFPTYFRLRLGVCLDLLKLPLGT